MDYGSVFEMRDVREVLIEAILMVEKCGSVGACEKMTDGGL